MKTAAGSFCEGEKLKFITIFLYEVIRLLTKHCRKLHNCEN